VPSELYFFAFPSYLRGVQLMLCEQDEGLEELGTAVDRVGRMADAMNQELNAQNRMLGDLEVEVENTNEQMSFVMGKLSKLLKTKGT
jgi:syntaxin 6